MQGKRHTARTSCGIGAGRFELPASRPQTGRSDQAELRPDETQSTAASRLLGLDERAQLGELLAAQLVALAAVDPGEQVAHERGELERVERLRHIVDTAD